MKKERDRNKWKPEIIKYVLYHFTCCHSCQIWEAEQPHHCLWIYAYCPQVHVWQDFTFL